MVLLLHPLIRASMTEQLIDWEKRSGLFGKKLMNKLHTLKCVERDGTVTLQCDHEDNDELNFDGGATSRYVACNVMAEVDGQNARERNMNLKVEGTLAIERLAMINKTITSGKLHLDVRQCKLDIN